MFSRNTSAINLAKITCKIKMRGSTCVGHITPQDTVCMQWGMVG